MNHVNECQKEYNYKKHELYALNYDVIFFFRKSSPKQETLPADNKYMDSFKADVNINLLKQPKNV